MCITTSCCSQTYKNKLYPVLFSSGLWFRMLSRSFGQFLRLSSINHDYFCLETRVRIQIRDMFGSKVPHRPWSTCRIYTDAFKGRMTWKGTRNRAHMWTWVAVWDKCLYTAESCQWGACALVWQDRAGIERSLLGSVPGSCNHHVCFQCVSTFIAELCLEGKMNEYCSDF